jgi:hypothetical protein
VRDGAEDEGEDAGGHQRLKDDPDDAQRGLLVAKFDVPQGESEHQIAELP